ncbi:MAG TPA: hypothetical protein VGR06_07835 [Actinophytocola sp.]|uniref:hypothetical protein n=1 Tax=Actinophytocola sp. TaxID=1872138 RepID=UPI002E0A99BA|nr:hypothetical protein [Actinophytocola sp.]
MRWLIGVELNRHSETTGVKLSEVAERTPTAMNAPFSAPAALNGAFIAPSAGFGDRNFW